MTMDDSKKLDLILERLDGMEQRLQAVEDKEAKKAEAVASSQEEAKPVAQEATAGTEEVETEEMEAAEKKPPYREPFADKVEAIFQKYFSRNSFALAVEPKLEKYSIEKILKVYIEHNSMYELLEKFDGEFSEKEIRKENLSVDEIAERLSKKFSKEEIFQTLSERPTSPKPLPMMSITKALNMSKRPEYQPH
jgi:signal recognition particle GTPase